MKPWMIGAAAALGVVGVVVALARRRGVPDHGNPSPEPEEPDAPMSNPKDQPLKAVVVGEATDPAVAPMLAQIQQKLNAAGVTVMSAFDLTVMTKAPLVDGPDPDTDKTRPVAIPDPSLWPGLVAIASTVDRVVKAELADVPLRFTGYREGYGDPSRWAKDGVGAGSYNRAVGGAKNSAHIRADAIDVWLGYSVLKQDAATIKRARERLRLAFAKEVINNPGSPYGFGVYTNDIHFDIDGRRTWGDASTWIKKARAIT